MNNSILHLVARALRARRTVTWSYATGLTLSNPFHGLTRSQILKDVRETYLDEPIYYTYGVEYDAALDRSKLPNPEAYGIWAYAYLPPPEPTPPVVPHGTRIRSLVALRLQNEAQLLRSLGNIFDTAQADKLQEISEFLSRSTEK
jgi:hypothetical protein